MSFYIYYDNVYYYLDSTDEVSITDTGQLTSHPTADKKKKSDNFIKNAPTAVYSGLITDIITPTSLKQMSTGFYIDALIQSMNNKSSVGFKYRLDSPEESDWFITSFKTTQARGVGVGGIREDGSVVQSFRVDMTLQKALFTDIVEVEFVVPQAYLDSLQPKTESSGVTKFKTDKYEDEPYSVTAAREAGRLQKSASIRRGEGGFDKLEQELREAEQGQ